MNIKYFEIARQIAQTLGMKRPSGRRNKSRIVAIIIPRYGNELFIGVNKMDEFHPSSPHLFKTVHAEFDAVKKARTKTNGADIYVYRQASYGQGLARPCRYCFPMLLKAGIKNIFYTDKDGFYSYTKGKLQSVEG